MALTATATKSTGKCVIKSLSLQAPIIVYVPPVKDNIVLDKPKDGLAGYFKVIVEKLKAERINMERICKTYDNVIAIYHYFMRQKK
jgi:superfamily II DNA helicase RecQ